ncbi:hypothetical protein DH2020_026256 [Rehmannia glutinosa]|uniref:Endonuclease/exonuclease/phosphatase domain-containing protein n=1 Tax=Rehmannia glutinosa TaxID=99300 RepID=A0ABR0W0J3_REHGL
MSIFKDEPNNLQTLPPPQSPWIICGDFNEVLTQSEFRAATRPLANGKRNSLEALSKISICSIWGTKDLDDMESFINFPHTQRARLDRLYVIRYGMISSRGHESTTHHLLSPTTLSSISKLKTEILIYSDIIDAVSSVLRLWVKVKNFEEVIKQNWDNTIADLPGKLEIALGLLNWSRHSQKDLNKQIEASKAESIF